MSSSESDALSRAETLLAAVDAIIAVHEICRDEPWLNSLYSAWRVHGLDADSVRPVAEIFTILGEPITKRTVMLSYAVTIPEMRIPTPSLLRLSNAPPLDLDPSD